MGFPSVLVLAYIMMLYSYMTHFSFQFYQSDIFMNASV